MDFVNYSGVEAGWTLGFERDGRELLIVAVKATYTLPPNGEEPVLAEKQDKLVVADEFAGEPGYSAPLRECDYAHRKLHCDVVLNGSAYAPHGDLAKSVRVSLRVGQMTKSFFVHGDRRFEDLMLSTGDPEFFVVAPVSYNGAYGGADLNEDEPEKVATYPENPVGTGYHPIRRWSALVGRLLPNTSEGRAPITNIKGRFRPMSFGPIGRNFLPRYRDAGTYDQHWIQNQAPFWPSDFSYEYFQCAPADQQTEFLEGGEVVELHNLTNDGYRKFAIPQKRIPVVLLPYRGADIRQEAICDTLVIEPDLMRFSLTWRLSLPLQRDIFELRQTIVGDLPYSWHSERRAQHSGKKYYPNLGALVNSKQKKRKR